MLVPGRPPTPRVAYAVGVRIHKTAQNSNSGAFFTPKKAAEDAWERTSMPPKLVHRDGIRRGGGGGGEGKTAQNSSSGAVLARVIYINRRGFKMGMPIGNTFEPLLPVPTLPRQSSAAPLAGRWWPRATQKHAPRSTFGVFWAPEASTTCLLSEALIGFVWA